MASPTTQGRLDGASRAELDAAAAAETIQINTDDLASVAYIMELNSVLLNSFRERLLDPGLSSLLYRPEIAGLATAAKAAVEDASNQFLKIAANTVKIAQMFAAVEAGYYGTGVPAIVWKQFLEAQITDPDQPLAFLDTIESVLDRKVGPASIKDANDLRTAIESVRSIAKFQDGVTTTGINYTLAKALRNGATRSQRQAARRAIAETLGVPPNGHIAGDVVNEFVEGGRYGSVDELIARVSAQSGRSVSAADANQMRATLLAAAPRFGRRVAVVHAALADKATFAAAKAAGLVGRVPGVAPTRAAIASKLTAGMNARVGKHTVGGLAKGAARKTFIALDVVMVPIDVHNAFTADSKLGAASAGTSAASGTLALAGTASVAGIISAPAAPFLFAGAGVMFVTSQVLGFADGRNKEAEARRQQQAYETAYTKSYEQAYPEAFERALNDQVDNDIQAINAKFEARRAKLHGALRATPSAITTERMAARAMRTGSVSGAAA